MSDDVLLKIGGALVALQVLGIVDFVAMAEGWLVGQVSPF